MDSKIIYHDMFKLKPQLSCVAVLDQIASIAALRPVHPRARLLSDQPQHQLQLSPLQPWHSSLSLQRDYHSIIHKTGIITSTINLHCNCSKLLSFATDRNAFDKLIYQFDISEQKLLQINDNKQQALSMSRIFSLSLYRLYSMRILVLSVCNSG